MKIPFFTKVLFIKNLDYCSIGYDFGKKSLFQNHSQLLSVYLFEYFENLRSNFKTEFANSILSCLSNL
jgi:hypothetical protein